MTPGSRGSLWRRPSTGPTSWLLRGTARRIEKQQWQAEKIKQETATIIPNTDYGTQRVGKFESCILQLFNFASAPLWTSIDKHVRHKSISICVINVWVNYNVCWQVKTFRCQSAISATQSTSNIVNWQSLASKCDLPTLLIRATMILTTITSQQSTGTWGVATESRTHYSRFSRNPSIILTERTHIASTSSFGHVVMHQNLF